MALSLSLAYAHALCFSSLPCVGGGSLGGAAAASGPTEPWQGSRPLRQSRGTPPPLHLPTQSSPLPASLTYPPTKPLTALRALTLPCLQLESVARLYAGLARAVDNTGRALLSTFMTRALEPLVHAASVCRSYPEAVNAILVFLRDYAEVHCSSLTVRRSHASPDSCNPPRMLEINSSTTYKVPVPQLQSFHSPYADPVSLSLSLS
jgi:hypothetical protein